MTFSRLRQRPRAILAALAFLVVGAASGPVAAQDIAKEAGEFVRGLGDKAIEMVADKAMAQPQREAKFRELFDRSFDVPAIGRFVMGRYWKIATEEQRQEFLKLFEEIVVKTYAVRFSEYSGEKFRVTGARVEAENHAIVNTEVVRTNGEPPIKVDWRVLKPKGELKIYDVMIEGVSMSVTQQEEYGAVIQRAGGQVEALLNTMRDRLKGKS